MNEDIINNVLNKIDSLNALMNENKESSSKVLVYLVNKTKEYDKTILSLRNDINDIIEAENNSYTEIEALKKEIMQLKEIENLQNLKIKELESKLHKHHEENKKSEKSFDTMNKTLFSSIESIRNEQATMNESIVSINEQIEILNSNVLDTKDYILIDKRQRQKTKIEQFIYKIFHYRQIKELERQKAEELELRRKQEEQAKIEQQLLEEQKIKENRDKIKDILNSTKI